jgi:hypothetical protein
MTNECRSPYHEPSFQDTRLPPSRSSRVQEKHKKRCQEPFWPLRRLMEVVGKGAKKVPDTFFCAFLVPRYSEILRRRPSSRLLTATRSQPNTR